MFLLIDQWEASPPDYTESSRIENLENYTSSSLGQSYMLPYRVMPSKFSNNIPSYCHLSTCQVGFYENPFGRVLLLLPHLLHYQCCQGQGQIAVAISSFPVLALEKPTLYQDAPAFQAKNQNHCLERAATFWR